MSVSCCEFSRLGSYLLSDTLGKGSHGVVRLGMHQKTGAKVAVKIMEKAALAKSPSVLVRLEREITALQKLHHPNVNRFVEFFETKSFFVIVTEFIHGGNLCDYIRETSSHKRAAQPHGSGAEGLSEIEAFTIFYQVLSALAYCHSMGVAHRDIKPDNVLIDKAFPHHAILADFGLCRDIHDQSVLLHTRCGSPLYAAPEVIRGEKYAGTAADVWSLGVILFSMVAGRVPFYHENLATLFQMICGGDYSMPRGIGPDLADLILSMMERSRKGRITVVQIKQHAWWTSNCARLGLDPNGIPGDRISFEITIPRKGEDDVALWRLSNDSTASPPPLTTSTAASPFTPPPRNAFADDFGHHHHHHPLPKNLSVPTDPLAERFSDDVASTITSSTPGGGASPKNSTENSPSKPCAHRQTLPETILGALSHHKLDCLSTASPISPVSEEAGGMARLQNLASGLLHENERLRDVLRRTPSRGDGIDTLGTELTVLQPILPPYDADVIALMVATMDARKKTDSPTTTVSLKSDQNVLIQKLNFSGLNMEKTYYAYLLKHKRAYGTLDALVKRSLTPSHSTSSDVCGPTVSSPHPVAATNISETQNPVVVKLSPRNTTNHQHTPIPLAVQAKTLFAKIFARRHPKSPASASVNVGVVPK